MSDRPSSTPPPLPPQLPPALPPSPVDAVRPARKRSPLLGILVSAGLAGVVWTVLAAAPSGGLLASKEPQLPGNGVIGLESRVPLPQFVPDEADRFPGWENVGAAVVRVSCEGGTGSGVLIGEGDRMLSAAHVFLNEGGQLRVGREVCTAIHPGGDRVPVLVQTLKGGEFAVPGPLESHFSFPVTMEDWVVLRLARPVRGGRPLPVASREEILLTDGQPVINIAGPQDNLAGDGFFGQVCQYRGVPPATSDVDATGRIIGRLAQDGDEWQVARYDCDTGGGASGSPVVGWFDGQPYIWGIITDSLRGRERCPDIGRTYCYTAGPLVTGMDVVP